MRSVTQIGLLALTIAAPSAVSAQETPTNFVGPRVEAVVGWDQLEFDLDQLGSNGTAKDSGLSFGFRAGYDFSFNSALVAGVEAGLGFSTTDDTLGGIGSYETGIDWSLAARLGARINDKALLYGKLGYSNLAVEVTDDTDSDWRHLDGILIGAGAEVAMSKSAYLKGEYQYSNYEDGVSRNQFLAGAGIRF